MKQIDELKETIYEHENKNSQLDFQMEDQKNLYSDQLSDMRKEVQKAKEAEADLNRKYESLRSKYEQDTNSVKQAQENEKMMNDQRIQDLEQQPTLWQKQVSHN